MGEDAGGKFLCGEGDGVLIVGRFLAGAVHGLQVGHIAAPNLHRRLRAASRTGEEGGVDEAAVIDQNLPIRGLHRLGRRLGSVRSRLSGLGAVILIGNPSLAAAGVRTDVRAVMFVSGGLAQGIGAGNHRLSL